MFVIRFPAELYMPRSVGLFFNALGRKDKCMRLQKFNVFHVRALYYTKKTLNPNECTKSFFASIITHSYMFRPCWVIFREKPSVVVALGCSVQLSENVLLTVYCAVYGGVNSL
jgi:hypothetical protein